MFLARREMLRRTIKYSNIFSLRAKLTCGNFKSFKLLNILQKKTSKLPHSLHTEENMPEVCLIVKDLDKKDRDYEKTVRKYQELVDKNKCDNIVKQVGFEFQTLVWEPQSEIKFFPFPSWTQDHASEAN